MPTALSRRLKLVPLAVNGLTVNSKLRALLSGEVAFLMSRKPAPGVTTQSNGLLCGEPDGNEQTLIRFGVAEAEMAVSGMLHAASMSASSSPPVKKSSPGSFSISQVIPVVDTDLTGEAQRSCLLSPQVKLSGDPGESCAVTFG